jgi:hypothetical protein
LIYKSKYFQLTHREKQEIYYKKTTIIRFCC